MAGVKMIRLKSIRDLVHVLGASQVPLVHHIQVDSSHVYFVPIVISSDSSVVYYYASETSLDGSFLLFDSFTGEVSISKSWVSDSKYMLVPIVEVDSQNIIPEKLLLRELSASKRNLRGGTASSTQP
uniref:Cren protein n=1 Tax=Thermofilum pendens TaxID=2269 RepID=A0A7C3WK63_THEPE